MDSLITLFGRWGCPLLLICMAACTWGGQTRAETDNVTVRYGNNGIPNFLKGENLSAPLENDLVFRALQAEERYGDIALHFLDSQRGRFHLKSAQDEFVLRSIDVDDLGQKHIKLDQVHQTIAVWGNDMGVHLNQKNQVFFIHGTYQPITPGLNTTAVLSRESAALKAIAANSGDAHWQTLDVALVVWAPNSDVQRLAFKVTQQREDLFRQLCFVDARDGKILHVLSLTRTEELKININ